MNRQVIIAGLMVLSITFAQPGWAKELVGRELSKQEFLDQFVQAFEAQDQAKITTLVKDNKGLIASTIGEILTLYISADLNGDLPIAEQLLTMAIVLAGSYRESFQKDILVKMVNLQRNWSLTEKKQKRQADELMVKGVIFFERYDLREAMLSFQSALDIYRALGDQWGEGMALINLGGAYENAGDYTKARDFLQRALQVARMLDDLLNEGKALNNLGRVYWRLGEYAKALDVHQQALRISRALGDRREEGNVLINLGRVHEHLGDHDEAVSAYQQVLQIARELGDQSLERDAIEALKRVRQK